MSITYHTKKSGAVYAYSVDKSYWDTEKKAPRTKQTYLGRVDPVTKDFIPTRPRRKPQCAAEVADAAEATQATADLGTQHAHLTEVTDVETASLQEQVAGEAVGQPVCPNVQVAGPYLLLETLAQKCGMTKLLKQCFPLLYAEILSLVYFLTQKGLPLSRCETWSLSHLHPYGCGISSQRISEWLHSMTAGAREMFMSVWLKKLSENDYLCYDITSISSYSQSNEYVRYGYNRDGERLPQVNLAMIFGQRSELPGYYRRLPGNITDVKTVQVTMKALEFLGFKDNKMHFILDRGFYSVDNITMLLEMRQHFTIALPTNRKWIEDIIDKHYEDIAMPGNYHKINNNETLYIKTEIYKWGDKKRRTYMHIYYNGVKAGAAFDAFTMKLMEMKSSLESEEISDKHKHYLKFFNINITPKRGKKVTFNEDAVRKYRNRYAGFFCILSTSIKDPEECLRIYRAKDAVENSFDDLKNHLDMNRLRVHSSSAMDNRMFIQFLSLILSCSIRKTIRTHDKLKHMTVREVLETLEPLVRLTYPNRYGKLYTETSPLQRTILDAFGITLNK
jgi:transposase